MEAYRQPSYLNECLTLKRAGLKADKRTEIMRLAIQSNDESDKRQFQFRMEQLKSGERQKDQQPSEVVNLAFGLSGLGLFPGTASSTSSLPQYELLEAAKCC
jgi:hypothetical protein